MANDDQGQMMVRFANGAMGHMFFSRIATGRKMGYAYEIKGTKGAIRFDQEDQNALWLYQEDGPDATRGFRKVLTGPAHPITNRFAKVPAMAQAIRTRSQSRPVIFWRPVQMALPAGLHLPMASASRALFLQRAHPTHQGRGPRFKHLKESLA